MNIKDIIIKSVYSSLTKEENALLEEWKQQDGNARLYDRIRSNLTDRHDGIAFMAEVDKEKPALGSLAAAEPRRKTSIVSTRLLKTAAAVAVLVIAGVTSLWYQDYTRVTPPQLHETVMAAIEESVRGGYADNQLGTAEVGASANITTVSRKMLEEYQLNIEDVEDLIDARQIETRRDRESWLRLDDGTIVHMSANSRIIYPEHFLKPSLLNRNPKREVILEGEAYFMVAHDRSRQFVVHTRQGDIVDYGTEFFTSAPTETKGGSTDVVLVSGSVGITPHSTESERILHPGEKATLHSDASISVSKVDVEPYKAWNTGKYEFYDKSLSDILGVLSRWYDVSVEYASGMNPSDIHLMGSFNRYGDIESALKTIEMSANVKITRKNSIIKVNQ